MIDLTIDRETRNKNIAFCRDKNILLPTFEMMRRPETIPQRIQDQLAQVAPNDLHPANLFRITWKNQFQTGQGPFGPINHVRLPPSLTGCRANIILLSGKDFPTGAHKVGATFGCLVPELVTGRFDPQTTRAVWPSTGNFCRGGAFLSALLSCPAVAVLPEGMSRERFEWLEKIAGEIITTPGSESNVKEIFDTCGALESQGRNLHIFNQFEELGNPLWHYQVTGPAVEEIMLPLEEEGLRYQGFVAASGSGGTLGTGYYLRKAFPGSKLAVAEALQCPTLLWNGHGSHRIEGIGDKHVPWIHDTRATDMVIGVDDALPMALLRLFNTETGKEALTREGIPSDIVEKLDFLGISGLGNLTAAIKFAKYYELTEKDVVVTIATDSMALYGSRLEELEREQGPYEMEKAWQDLGRLRALGMDALRELNYYDRKALHNLKYFTWVEQQGKDVDELDAQWMDHDSYWDDAFNKAGEIDALIREFNAGVMS
ncbi:MAG: pyridoxal-phosphate dependent enzyme [Desulfobacterales bacterium]|nr:pyridoxal-phosphate dependent enzyme [Desulfobacterales bacterium]